MTSLTHTVRYNLPDEMPSHKIVYNDYRKITDKRLSGKLSAIELSNTMNFEIEFPLFLTALKPFVIIPMILNVSDDLTKVTLALPDNLLDAFNIWGIDKTYDGAERIKEWLLKLNDMIKNYNKILKDPMVNTEIVIKPLPYDKIIQYWPVS